MTLHLKFPLTPNETDVIDHIVRAAHEMNVELFIVGAMARIILLEKVYGLPATRASRDIDFAVVVENWQSFEIVKNKLCEQYQRAGNFERLFDEFSEQLEVYNDPNLVSAWMLGHDTALISGPKKGKLILSISAWIRLMHFKMDSLVQLLSKV